MPGESNTKIISNFEEDLTVPVDANSLVLPLDTTKEDLKAHLDSMLVKATNGEIKCICRVCGKSIKGKDWGGAKFNMRRHIETHIEGLSYTCNQCGNISR